MSQDVVDLVRLAMEHALMINESLKRGGQREAKGTKFRARARELPSLVLDAGLVPALLFFLSKAGKSSGGSVYGDVVKALPCDGRRDNEQNEQNSKKLYNKNEYAYAAVARAVLCALKKLGYTEGYNIDTLECAIRFLMEELRGKQKEISATVQLMDYLVSFKRVAEALWESGGGEE